MRYGGGVGGNREQLCIKYNVISFCFRYSVILLFTGITK